MESPRLPLVGVVLAVVGLCIPPLGLVALGIGAYSWNRSRFDARWLPRRQVAQLTVFTSAAGLVVFVALFLPALRTIPLRREQARCVEQLKTLKETFSQTGQPQFSTQEPKLTLQVVYRDGGTWEASCTQQLDADSTIDDWRLSSSSTVSPLGETIAPLQVWNAADDVRQ